MNQEDINPYAAPLSNVTISEPAQISEAPSAGGGKRFLNYLIDHVAMLGVFFLIGVLTAILDEQGITYRASQAMAEISGLENILFSCGVTLLYYTCLEGTCGRSLGKWITGTKVVTASSGLPVSYRSALMRSLSRLVPFEAFSFLGSDASGWHDKWTDTRVVDLRAAPVVKPRPMSAVQMPRMYTPPSPR